jgi:hypothetical protein
MSVKMQFNKNSAESLLRFTSTLASNDWVQSFEPVLKKMRLCDLTLEEYGKYESELCSERNFNDKIRAAKKKKK